jgi:hypothetical protein
MAIYVGFLSVRIRATLFISDQVFSSFSVTVEDRWRVPSSTVEETNSTVLINENPCDQRNQR